MMNKIKLEECLKCVHHVSLRDAAVMCKYFHREEQRMTQIFENIPYLINCPRDEEDMD